MKAFTILGERNSGTHFLQYAIIFNFHLEYHKGTKHFFGHSDVADFPLETKDHTIYFCMVRHPIEWVDSLFKRLHHIPPENKVSADAFVKNEWYSIYEEGEKKGQEILEDRDMVTQNRYANILEMRKGKLNFFLQMQTQQKCKYFYLINYEDLRNNYATILNDIAARFHLERKYETWIPVPKYKGTFNALYEKKPILLSAEIQQYIKDHIDIEQERRFGYLIET